MEVNALTISALLLLVAALCSSNVMRKRAERRAEEERERARARRRRVPAVSANVRGLPSEVTDLWADETRAAPRRDRPS